MQSYFPIGEPELAWLKGRDPLLGQLIEQIGIPRRAVWPEPFTGFMRAISGQQISAKAHAAIWGKFIAAHGAPRPETIAGLAPEDFRSCGISRRKASYMLRIAQAFQDGRLAGEELAGLDDASLRARLKKFAGIGDWTVDMLLIFTFMRPNVLSYGDFAIRRGMSALYGHEKITPEVFAAHYRAYAPYATVAGFYLWEAAALPLKDSR